MIEKVIFTWSGGKDSAMSLHILQREYDCTTTALLTTLTEGYDRISMHGVRGKLLEMQAEAIGIPLEKIVISMDAPNDEYEKKMKDMLQKYKDEGISTVVFGDIFLEDLRKYREDNLAKIGMKALFPLWKRDTAKLAREFISLGFHAIITCVDTNVLDGKFAGREYDLAFLDDLPVNVDPCGENGEFHSFVYDGPILKKPIPIKKGESVLRDNRFAFCDIFPSG